jgi:tetratricopeptide (TPR) repeat protein
MTSAALLVCESLEEQGEWDRALGLLEQVTGDLKPDHFWLKEALTCIANAALGRYDESQLASQMDDLLLAVPSVLEPFTVAVMARAISGLVISKRSVELGLRALGALANHDLEIASSPARQDWLTAQLRIQCLLGDPSEVETSLSALSSEMIQTKTRSSSAAVLAVGRGGVCCAQGKYREALEHFTNGLAIATELGNGTLIASVHANRALCFGMLGNFDQQIAAAKESLRYERELSGSYRRVLARYHVAIGHALRGERVEAYSAAQELADMPLEAATQWVQQARHLYLADALWLAGKKRAALTPAGLGTSRRFARPVATAFTGTHARWLARLQPAARSTRTYLAGLFDRRAQFDLIDQVEIALACQFVIEGQEQSIDCAAAPQAREMLSRLPSACSHILAELGMLPVSRRRQDID